MQKVSSEDKSGMLDATEVLKDYGRKITAACRGRIYHEQDDSGATLVFHVAARGVDEAESTAKLAERLKAVSEGISAEVAAASKPAEPPAAVKAPVKQAKATSEQDATATT